MGGKNWKRNTGGRDWDKGQTKPARTAGFQGGHRRLPLFEKWETGKRSPELQKTPDKTGVWRPDQLSHFPFPTFEKRDRRDRTGRAPAKRNNPPATAAGGKTGNSVGFRRRPLNGRSRAAGGRGQPTGSGAVGKNERADALHIALATIARVDVLVSWNFKHIVNLRRIHAFNAVNLKQGYPVLEIRNPREVVGDE